MLWSEEEQEEEFGWMDEDEEEVPAGEGTTLTRINKIAVVVFLSLLGLGAVYFAIRLVKAWSGYFG